MIHPHTELQFINQQVGYGVVATQLIPKGTIAWVLDALDQKLDEAYVNSLHPVLRQRVIEYSFRDYQGRYILCWDNARFVNHSFHATLICTPYNLELAVRDIYPGEQLTDDYGCFNLDEPFNCLPEPNTSRTQALPDDILRYYPEWDRLAAEAMQQFTKVSQPLQQFIDPLWRDKVTAVAEGRAAMDSILLCYYDRAHLRRKTHAAPDH